MRTNIHTQLLANHRDKSEEKNNKTYSGIAIGDFRNVLKFHAYSVNKRLFLTTAKLVPRFVRRSNN